jgi:hypothetical protein
LGITACYFLWGFPTWALALESLTQLTCTEHILYARDLEYIQEWNW